MVAWLPLPAPQSGDPSRYLFSLAPRPQPLLQRLRDCSGTQPTPELQIAWPDNWPGRVRRVISRSGTRRRYAVPRYRYGEAEAHGEAKEEELAFILLDACDGVEFQEQPCRLTFRFHGEVHEHIPDILVAAPDRCEFWECKRTHEADQFWIRKRAALLRTLLAPLNIRYQVVTTHQLTAGSYLNNARLLRRFAKHPVSEATAHEATLRLHDDRSYTVGQLNQHLASADPYADIYALLYSGKVRANLAETLDADSPLHPPHTDGTLPWVWRLFAPASA